jgi:hypothetical protein
VVTWPVCTQPTAETCRSQHVEINKGSYNQCILLGFFSSNMSDMHGMNIKLNIVLIYLMTSVSVVL